MSKAINSLRVICEPKLNMDDFYELTYMHFLAYSEFPLTNALHTVAAQFQESFLQRVYRSDILLLFVDSNEERICSLSQST
jgi:hypothetical protein